MSQDPNHLRTIPDLPVTFRAMFGGIMAYAEGKPFASLSDVGLALKLSGTDHADMLALDGAPAALRAGRTGK